MILREPPLTVKVQSRYQQQQLDLPGCSALMPLWNLDGVVWFDAEPPRRCHRHWPQTVGEVDLLREVWRCPCGAIGGPMGALDSPRSAEVSPMVEAHMTWWLFVLAEIGGVAACVALGALFWWVVLRIGDWRRGRGGNGPEPAHGSFAFRPLEDIWWPASDSQDETPPPDAGGDAD